jgi:hypothetical protein
MCQRDAGRVAVSDFQRSAGHSSRNRGSVLARDYLDIETMLLKETFLISVIGKGTDVDGNSGNP